MCIIVYTDGIWNINSCMQSFDQMRMSQSRSDRSKLKCYRGVIGYGALFISGQIVDRECMHWFAANMCRGFNASQRFSCCDILVKHKPANTRRWAGVGLMLGRRRLRWANMKPTLGQYLLFIENPWVPRFFSFNMNCCCNCAVGILNVWMSSPVLFVARHLKMTAQLLEIGKFYKIPKCKKYIKNLHSLNMLEE